MKFIVFCVSASKLPYHFEPNHSNSDPTPNMREHTEAKLKTAFPSADIIQIYHTVPDIEYTTFDTHKGKTYCKAPYFRLLVDSADIKKNPNAENEFYIEGSSSFAILSATCGSIHFDFYYPKKKNYYPTTDTQKSFTDDSWSDETCQYLADLTERYSKRSGRKWFSHALMLKASLMLAKAEDVKESAQTTFNLIANELDVLHASTKTNYTGDYFAMLCVAMEIFQTRSNFELLDAASKVRLALHQTKLVAYKEISTYCDSVYAGSFFGGTHWTRAQNLMVAIARSRNIDDIRTLLHQQKAECTSADAYAQALHCGLRWTQ